MCYLDDIYMIYKVGAAESTSNRTGRDWIKWCQDSNTISEACVEAGQVDYIKENTPLWAKALIPLDFS